MSDNNKEFSEANNNLAVRVGNSDKEAELKLCHSMTVTGRVVYIKD